MGGHKSPTAVPGEIKRSLYPKITFDIIHRHCRPLARKSPVSISIRHISPRFVPPFRSLLMCHKPLNWRDNIIRRDQRWTIADRRSTLGDIMDYGLWRSRAAYVCQSNNFEKILSRYVANDRRWANGRCRPILRWSFISMQRIIIFIILVIGSAPRGIQIILCLKYKNMFLDGPTSSTNV